MFLHSSAMKGEEWRACCLWLRGRDTQSEREEQKIQVEQDYFKKYREHKEEFV